MAPVDGGLTLPLPEVDSLLEERRCTQRSCIPMHWSSTGSLQDFLAGMEGQFRVDVRAEPLLDVSLRGLPRQPRTIMVMPPRLLGVEAP